MLISLHKQATYHCPAGDCVAICREGTPRARAEIQASTEPAWVLADRYGTTEQTVYKWRHRDSVSDRSHTPHRLQTTLTPTARPAPLGAVCTANHERGRRRSWQYRCAPAFCCRSMICWRSPLSLGPMAFQGSLREFLNPDASRSGLDRCLRRHGVSNLRDLRAKAPDQRISRSRRTSRGLCIST